MGAPTLPARLLELAASDADRVALRHKKLGRWEETTWAQYAQQATQAGLGLAALGVGPGDRVAVHAENRPEWLVADLGIQGIGAVTVGVYPTSPEAELLHLLGDSGSVVVIAENEEQYDKAMAVRGKLPDLRHIVVIDTRGITLGDPMVMTYDDLLALGAERAEREPDAYAEQVARLDPAAPAIIVYTSGTTGPPKGAMLSHRNLLAVGEAASEVYPATHRDETLSYLPLSHIAERLLSLIDALVGGYVVNFGEGGDTFVGDLREVQPTIFLGVPRVWEKMLAGVMVRVADASRLKRWMFNFWVGQGRRRAARRMKGDATLVDRVVLGIGWLLLFRSLRDKLGMSRVRIALSGAAPISPQVLEFFWAIGVPIREAYGQTENSAMATSMPADDVRIGTVGTALPGVELRIADDGEILTRCAGVFLGYYGNEAATREVVDEEGWLHTGDVGTLDDDGFLTITDRKKDLIITAGGKNVAPSEIENMLKVSPYIREAVVIGDRRPYLTALVGIEPDTVGDWATRRRIGFTTYRDLSRKPEVVELIGESVAAVNADLAQVETIKQFRLLPKELDQEEGELTATQKVKRAAIAKEFDGLIEEMYGGKTS
jgi:long-chain acyl-CoA synthetase